MYICEGLSKKNFNQFLYLNNSAKEFNSLNFDYKEAEIGGLREYLNFKKNITLIKDKDRYIALVWQEKDDDNSVMIKSINFEKGIDYREVFNSYVTFKNIEINTLIKYSTANNNRNYEILERIGFQPVKLTLQLSLDIKDFPDNSSKEIEGVSFQLFQEEKDELLRCNIQNEIFKSKDRCPLNIDDIYYDQIQDYYLKDASVFLRYNNKYVGYGQIIMEDSPVIVNFGIIDSHRAKGLGSLLLSKLLEIAKNKGLSNIKIRVFKDNEKALNLYRNFGFKIEEEYIDWEIKIKKR